MKPNKETEYNDFVKWSEELCDKRHKASIDYRKKKACNNPFKKWFYLGKKVKITVYKATAFVVNTNTKITIDRFFRKSDAETFVKNFDSIAYTNSSVEESVEKVYSIENYGNTPYDKLRWKAIKKWQKKIEKYGLEIRRPYFYNGKEKYHIWNSHLEYDNVYKKFCKYWWKNQFERIINTPKYHYKTCWYDYFDLYQSLIVKLTIKGLYLGLYGNSVTHKEQMHEICECRKELIKAYNFEDWYEFTNVKSKIKEKFGIDYEICNYDVEKYLETGNIIPSKSFNLGINPKVIENLFDKDTDKFREDVIKKCKEINAYLEELLFSEENIAKQKEKYKEIKRHAFELLADNIENWWD